MRLFATTFNRPMIICQTKGNCFEKYNLRLALVNNETFLQQGVPSSDRMVKICRSSYKVVVGMLGTI